MNCSQKEPGIYSALVLDWHESRLNGACNVTVPVPTTGGRLRAPYKFSLNPQEGIIFLLVATAHYTELIYKPVVVLLRGVMLIKCHVVIQVYAILLISYLILSLISDKL